MPDVLVTGASGFIGSHLVEELVARGNRVRCLVRRNSSRRYLEPLGVECLEGDVKDLASLERAVSGVEIVYNLAGMISTLKAADQSQVNGLGVENLAKACAAQVKPPVHVLVSSIAAAGPAARDQLRVESQRAAPISNYGRSKRQGELAAEKWAASVPTTIVRPGIVFGQRDRLMLPMYKSIAHFHLHAVAGISSPKLSFVQVKDLTRLLIAAAERGERVIPGVENQRRVNGATAAGTLDEPSADERAANGAGTLRALSTGAAAVEHAAKVAGALRVPSPGVTSAHLPSEADETQGLGYYQACMPEYPDCLQLGRLLARAIGTRFVLYLPLVQPLPWFVAGCSELGGRFVGRAATLSIDKIREATVVSWACSGEKARTQLGFCPSQPLADQFRDTAAWYKEQGWL